jgi:hypothetical protein
MGSGNTLRERAAIDCRRGGDRAMTAGIKSP